MQSNGEIILVIRFFIHDFSIISVMVVGNACTVDNTIINTIFDMCGVIRALHFSQRILDTVCSFIHV